MGATLGIEALRQGGWVAPTQQLLVQGVPQALLAGDAVVEPAEHALAVGALRGGGEAEQEARPQVAN